MHSRSSYPKVATIGELSVSYKLLQVVKRKLILVRNWKKIFQRSDGLVALAEE